MKCLQILLLGCVAYVVAVETVLDDISSNEYEPIKPYIACLELYGQTQESIEDLSTSEQSCILHLCLLRHYGIINEDKSFNGHALLKTRKSHASESKTRDAIKACSSKSQESLQDSCEALSCIQHLLPASDSNYPED